MARNLRIVRARMDLLKQVVYIVERSSSKEEKEDALRRLSKLLEDLETEYNELLLGGSQGEAPPI